MTHEDSQALQQKKDGLSKAVEWLTITGHKRKRVVQTETGFWVQIRTMNNTLLFRQESFFNSYFFVFLLMSKDDPIIVVSADKDLM